MREQVTLTIKEQKRLKVLNDLEAGTTSIQEALEVLGLFVCQVYRLRARYRVEGAAALAQALHTAHFVEVFSGCIHRSTFPVSTGV
jgi:hypothetical protein